MVTYVISMRSVEPPFASAGGVGDLLHDLDALDDAPEDRELPVERRLIGDAR